jgi:hypothetical protein
MAVIGSGIRRLSYGEFDAANRAPGWTTWLTFAISPEAPSAATATRHMVTK